MHAAGVRNRPAVRLGFGARHRDLLIDGGFTVTRNQIALHAPIKMIGLHTVPVALHPEVEVKVTINVARNADEAERQARGENMTQRREEADEEAEAAAEAAAAFFEKPEEADGDQGKRRGREDRLSEVGRRRLRASAAAGYRAPIGARLRRWRRRRRCRRPGSSRRQQPASALRPARRCGRLRGWRRRLLRLRPATWPARCLPRSVRCCDRLRGVGGGLRGELSCFLPLVFARSAASAAVAALFFSGGAAPAATR